MSLDLEAEKLQAKVDWLKEHLNTKKSAEKLDAEFARWHVGVAHGYDFGRT